MNKRRSEEEKKKWSEEEMEWRLNRNFGYRSVALVKPNERQPKSAFRAPKQQSATAKIFVKRAPDKL
jgi:hypothetical protein